MKEAEKYRFADVHCHILPGVDDGAKNLGESLEMLKIAAKEGITDMILTPHAISDLNPGSEMLRKVFSEFQKKVAEAAIPVNLSLGNEIYYLDGTADRLDRGELCTLAGTKRVLVEFGPTADYIYIRNSLQQIQMAGYQPILAHAERYVKLISVERIGFLKGNGIEIQVNAASVSGEVGFGVKRFVKKLLDLGHVDYVGTDAHSPRKRAPRVQKCLKYLYAKYDAEYVDSIVYQNTKAIMDTKERT